MEKLFDTNGARPAPRLPHRARHGQVERWPRDRRRGAQRSGRGGAGAGGRIRGRTAPAPFCTREPSPPRGAVARSCMPKMLIPSQTRRASKRAVSFMPLTDLRPTPQRCGPILHHKGVGGSQ